MIHSPGAIACAIFAPIGLYAAFLGLLTIPFIQNQVIYLNKVTLTWGKDINIPEQWGFLHNQVSPFHIKTSDGETLHAWHILPPGLYRQHEQELISEPSGLVPDITERLGFKLLRDDPESLLVLYLHGAAGTLGSGHRPPSYRAISAGAPNRIHIVAIDYRGFGTSTGTPSEGGLLVDAVALVDWAIKEAGLPSSRIVIWSQSIGTAVATTLVEHMASLPQPVFFSGLVMVAPFVDVKTLTSTYRVAGTIPLLEPVAHFPRLLDLLNSFIRDKWPSAERLASFVRNCERMPPLTVDESGNKAGHYYRINIIHAEDDYDIPWSHSDQMFWSAVNAFRSDGITFRDLEMEKEAEKVTLGAGGWTFSRETTNGIVREDILKHGLHDWIMGYPIVSLAVMRAFDLNP
ncbi:hypothetical protein Daus18300_001121 [Diaporthe australafricana]|uniref:AB hydrolase-1 domain-containing protein n=1 Tax=Diaporthe australafricana TaxID=127596 RepID=A0ABR3Y0J1_9PEZI